MFYDILPGTTSNDEIAVSLITDITSNTSIIILGGPTIGTSYGELMCMSYFILIACTILLGHLYLIEVVTGVIEIMIVIIMTIVICVKEGR